MYISGVTIKDYLYPAAAATPYAASFNGSSQYLSVANNAGFQFGTGDFTIECWVYTNSSATQRIISVSSGSGLPYEFLLVNSTTNVYLDFFDGSTDISTGSNYVPQNQWAHLAITRQGTALKLFINGVVSGSSTNSTSLNATGSLAIGRYSPSSVQYFSGYISNVRVIKGTALYTSNFAVPSSPLTAIAGTQLLTCNAATLVDGSTNAFTLTNNGSVTTTSATVPSFAGYSNSFNGSSSYLLSPQNPSQLNLGSNNFTIEFWFNTSTLVALSNVFTAGPAQSGGANRGYALQLNALELASPTITFYTNNTSGIFNFGYTSTITLSAWHHLALVRFGNNLYCWLDGVQSGTTQTITGSITNISSTDYFGIGGISNSPSNNGTPARYWYTGYISNFRIVTGTALYTSNFTPPTSPLQNISGTQLLTCNESTIVDNSSNGFAITNNNGVTVSTSTIPFTLATTPTAVGTGGIVVYERPYVSPLTTFTLSALVVAGGGGGTPSYAGGGAGGVILSAFNVALGTPLTVVIGSGGTAGNNGNNSTVYSLTAVGGGAGGSYSGAGNTGGSGGGGGSSVSVAGAGGAGTVGQGNNGGSGNVSATGGGSGVGANNGGGGGAGSVGGNSTTTAAGAGGIGIYNSLTNLAQVGQLSAGNYYVGGGGGGGTDSYRNITAYAPGGLGGGGTGSGPLGVAGTAGTANTGGGGGGGNNGTTGTGAGAGAGGSGVAILASPYVAAVSALSGSPTITLAGGNYIYTFNNNGYLTYTNNTFLNYAASFNGTNQYLTAGTNSNWTFLNNGSSNFTVECWFNVPSTSLSNSYTIVSTSTSTANIGFSLELNDYSSGDVTVVINKGTSGTSALMIKDLVGNKFSANTWNHLAVVFNSSTSVCTVYMNGVSILSATGSGFSGSAPTYTLATGRYQAATPGGYLSGYINNLRITNTAVYTSNFTPPTTHLTAVSGTQLLTCQNAALVDNSTNNFTITNNNSVTTTYTQVPFNY
jgi:Concanavalin A-like lectin/glucanases superfamily